MRFDRAAGFQALLFLIAIAAGFVYVALRLTSSDGRDAVAGLGWRDLLEGVTTRKIDAVVVAALPTSHSLDGLQAGLEYRVFDDAGPQVRAGCPGWLFLGEEVLEVVGGDENVLRHLAIARRMAVTFARRGVALVMITVPDKARVAAADLCAQRVSPQAVDRLARWESLVRSVPLPRVDIVRGWPGHPGYWRTDTHWDRLGASFAANRTAAVVNRILRGRGSERATVAYGSTAQPRPGDLMHLSGLEFAPPWLQPPPDMDVSRTVTWERSGGLLDAGPPADVVLTGSSYSKNSGFADSLSLALGREVVQLSEDGGGFDGSLIDLLTKHPDTLAHAKVVVWEFPERSLTQPLTDDERALLRP